MGKLSAIFRRNKNGTEISYDQLDVRKLYGNIQKSYKLYIFEDIAIGCEKSLQSSSSFSDVIPAKSSC